MIDQVALAGHVTLVHAADLRHRHVRLVDDQEEVVGEVVEQGVRGGTGAAPVDVAGVVLDTRAEPDLTHHLDVVGGAHPQPLGLEQLALRLHRLEAQGKLPLDTGDRPFHPLRAGDIVGGGEDEDLLRLADDLTGERMQVGEPLDLVTEHLDAHGELLVHGEHLHRVTAHPERASGERQVVARVLDIDQPAQQRVALDFLADAQADHPVDVLLRSAKAVDAAHGRHDDDIAAGEQVHRGRVPQPLDLLVDRGVLLDVGVGLRDVRLGLVVVVVRDEVLDGVVRQQLAELVGQLGGEGLVRRHHQRRALQPLDQPGRRRGLTGTGRAEQDDVGFAGLDPPGQILDRGRLVTGRGVVGHDLERGARPLEIGGGPFERCAHVLQNTTALRQFPPGRSTTVRRAATRAARPARPVPTGRPVILRGWTDPSR